MPGARWQVATRREPASQLHARVPRGEGRVAEWYEVERPAIVLGSAQRDDVIDPDACAAAGVEVVQRRSGGGVVLLVPGESLWLDVVVPAGDPCWDDDVARSMWWLGEVWCEALETAGALDGRDRARLGVHRAAAVHTRWSRLVCFDGIGSGEVVAGDRKVVGISQRRTRHWLRLQSSLHVAWRPELLVSLLAGSCRPTSADLRVPLTIEQFAVPAVQAALETSLAAR